MYVKGDYVVTIGTMYGNLYEDLFNWLMSDAVKHVFLEALGIGSVIVLLDYLIGSFAYYKALKLYEYKYPIAAWVPFWSEFAISDCFSEEEYQEATFLEGVTKSAFRWHSVLRLGVYTIPIFGQILAFITSTIGYGITYMVIIKNLNNEPEYTLKRKVLGYISSWVSIIFYIQMFMVDSSKVDRSKYTKRTADYKKEMENS